MSKAEYTVIAAATKGVMDIFEQNTWGKWYSSSTTGEMLSFPGTTLLFLCEYGFEFYEALEGRIKSNVELSNRHNRGWTASQLTGNVKAHLLKGSHFAINGIGLLGQMNHAKIVEKIEVHLLDD